MDVLFDRVNGLEAIFVSDLEGSILLRDFRTKVDVDKKKFSQVVDNFIASSDKINRLNIGKLHSVLVFFSNHIIVQCTFPKYIVFYVCDNFTVAHFLKQLDIQSILKI